MQLVAYGAQDVFLTGTPEITFWKVSYRRHTNFAMESIEQTFSGQADFGRRVTCTISRNGDLAYRTYLQVTLPEINQSMAGTAAGSGVFARWLDFVGEQLIAQVEVEIGGQRIDRQYGDWLHIWNQVTMTSEQQRGYFKLIGNTTQLTYLTDPSFASIAGPCAAVGSVTQVCAPRNALPETTLYVPLLFWFCRNPGLALPLIALQYHEVKINLDIRPIGECLWAVNTLSVQSAGSQAVTTAYQQSLVAASLYVDYIFLDTDERRKMAQNPHEYLIEQVQYTPSIGLPESASQFQCRVEFNHPIREFIFVLQRNVMESYHEWFNYSSLPISEVGVRRDLLSNALLQLDGQDRFQERDAGYFRLVQPWQRHTVIPNEDFIYVYSFALRPEDLQPTGSMNASRIDSIVWQITTNQTTVPPRGNCVTRIYATNHNVLRVVDGFGGLLFTI
jgi:hypothetical protein